MEEQIGSGSSDPIDTMGESPLTDESLEASELEVDLGDGGLQGN